MIIDFINGLIDCLGCIFLGIIILSIVCGIMSAIDTHVIEHYRMKRRLHHIKIMYDIYMSKIEKNKCESYTYNDVLRILTEIYDDVDTPWKKRRQNDKKNKEMEPLEKEQS